MTTPRPATLVVALALAMGCVWGSASASSASSEWPQPLYDAGQTNRNPDESWLSPDDIQALREVSTVDVPGEVTGFVVADHDLFVTWAVRSSGLVVGGGVARVGLDGTPVWSRDDPCEFSEPAVIAGSLLYRSQQTMTCFGPPFPPVVAVDAVTGEDQRWSESLWWFLPARDSIFAATAIMDDRDGAMQTGLRAMDPVTGDPSWDLPIDPPNPTHYHPVAADGSLFVRRYFDGVQAFDEQTGEERWSWDLVPGSGLLRPFAAADRRLFVERYTHGGDRTVRLVARETLTGDHLWTRWLDPNWQSSANELRQISVFPRAVVLSQDTSVQALDPATGSRLWHRELFAPGLTGAGRFLFVGGTRADGSRTTLVLQAATGRRVGRLDAITGQPIVAAGGVLWAEGSTIHIWR